MASRFLPLRLGFQPIEPCSGIFSKTIIRAKPAIQQLATLTIKHYKLEYINCEL